MKLKLFRLQLPLNFTLPFPHVGNSQPSLAARQAYYNTHVNAVGELRNEAIKRVYQQNLLK